MKILVVIPSGQKSHNGVIIPAKYSGVDYHRLLIPHDEIGRHCEVSQINSIDNMDPIFLSGFDIIVVNRFITREGNRNEVLKSVRESGAKLVVDMDDDYKLPDWHILKSDYLKQHHAESILFGLKNADAITVTHELMAEMFKKETGNKNVFVVPNAINPSEAQFELKKSNTKKITFGWSGSITHLEDVILMHDSLLSLYKSNYNNSFRMIYGGFTPTDEYSRMILGVLSAKGVANEQCFATYPSASVHEYARFYDNIDVSLIPLRDNRFNNMKSNLKLLESGFKHRAAIVSGVQPYLPMLKHGINCLMVKKKHDWYRHMTKLINNPSLVNDLADSLHEDVQEYHVEKVAQTRLNAYKEILCLSSR